MKGEGVGGHRRGEGLRQIKHLPQSPFTCKFFLITTFGIAFYQFNLSTDTTFREKSPARDRVCYEEREGLTTARKSESITKLFRRKFLETQSVASVSVVIIL